jgi:hypothetical protein
LSIKGDQLYEVLKSMNKLIHSAGLFKILYPTTGDPLRNEVTERSEPLTV